MFCPQCGAEYVDGILECADCGVPLTLEPVGSGEEDSGIEVELVEVVRVSTLMDRTLVESLLTEAGIEFVSGGGQLESSAFPFDQPVTFRVAAPDEARAREVLSRLEQPVSPEAETLGEEDQA